MITAAVVPSRTIHIDRAVPSCNLWTNKRGFGTQRIYREERNTWMLFMRVSLVPRTARKEHVTITIVSRRKLLLDFANFIGGCKPIIDNLRTLGYLYDDAPKWFTGIYEQVKAPAALRGTMIVIHAGTA